MGIIDKARAAVVDAVTPNFVKKINTALTPQSPGAPDPNAAQASFEARERAMNRNNPHYKNVDNSGLTKEPFGGK